MQSPKHDASEWSTKALLKSEYSETGGPLKPFFSCTQAFSCSSPHTHVCCSSFGLEFVPPVVGYQGSCYSYSAYVLSKMSIIADTSFPEPALSHSRKPHGRHTPMSVWTMNIYPVIISIHYPSISGMSSKAVWSSNVQENTIMSSVYTTQIWLWRSCICIPLWVFDTWLAPLLTQLSTRLTPSSPCGRQTSLLDCIWTSDLDEQRNICY